MGIKLSTAAPLRGDKRWHFIQRAHDIRVATVAADEPIYVTALWFVVKDRKIYLPLDQANRHVQNLERDGRLSGVIDEGHSLADVRGVNIEGTATPVDDDEMAAELEELVLEKYFYPGDPYLEEYVNFGQYNHRKFYEVVPTRMWGWDLREATVLASSERRTLPDSFFEGSDNGNRTNGDA
jgi:nitroimidazol reductase NimA-like FMN-containing flavoprotein (pyridoxamine 5'-phosphate oxidase superfamily)